MKRTAPLILILIMSVSWSNAQKVLTLKECYDMALTTNAIAGEKDAYSNISRIKDENLAKGWLPTIDANANFIYNSDVVDFAAATASVPAMSSLFQPMPQDQYKLTLDINQVIYDGGAIKSAREIEKADLRLNEKQTESDLYKLKGQVNKFYFNIMLLNRQKELLDNYLSLINKRISAMQSGVNNGVLLKPDIDVLVSEKLKLEQQLTENKLRCDALVKILSDITGNEIDNSTRFILPAEPSEMTDELIRPELQMFDLRKDQLSAGLKMVQSKRMPRAFGFATLGYGNPPGQNFFNDSFDTYYVIGAGIKWNIFDWNKARNEKQVISLQQGIIENRKNDLADNLKRQLESKRSEINSLRELVKTDTELIELRKRITSSSQSQYENGTITATEFMNELNAEKTVSINYEIHRISLALAGIEYMNISGKEIE
ncbi:MAG: TolC family protein [Bacteroidetes bacterium]|nr:TolC family protein [Bacteroidota bacterium]